jgi:hypothetical protein
MSMRKFGGKIWQIKKINTIIRPVFVDAKIIFFCKYLWASLCPEWQLNNTLSKLTFFTMYFQFAVMGFNNFISER